jgi:acetyl-CoA carboxylase biotin carboxyl carrier protein
MAENPLGPAKPLDVERLHYLVRLMKRYDLTALDVSDSSVRIRLRRSSPAGALPLSPSGAPPITSAAPASSPGAPPAAPVKAEPSLPPAAPAHGTTLIESPMVGTYYASSAPDASPFVTVGSVVQSSTTVCIIEAMKVFTDIPAGVSGTIAEVLVKNGQAVEFGQPLFRVIPA